MAGREFLPDGTDTNLERAQSRFVAMEVTEELAQYSEESTKLREESAAAPAEESGAKSEKRKMMD